MATKPKSHLSFLKEALLLPNRNPKLFVPVFILVAIPTLLINIANVLCIQPLAVDVALRITKIKNIDPTSAEYARLLQEIEKEARELIVIAIALVVTPLVLGFAKQIVAHFAASTTYSGERYSLPELLSRVIKGRLFTGPSITIALVTVLEIACMAFLAVLLQLVMHRSGEALPTTAAGLVVFVLGFLAFLYFNVVFVVTVAVSVADTERRGVSALRRAWRLMTRVRRKEACVLVVVINLLSTALSPLYVAALGYTKKSTVMGLALLSTYALLSGVVQLFYFAAATVYYYQAMESKELVAQDYYIKIPTGEANV